MKTICAIATAQGGAVGIVRVSGSDAIDIVNKIFSKDISSVGGYTMHYGHIMDVDDVIVSVCRAPRSYTGENTVEISCHGSSFILQQVLQLLVDNGCMLAGPGEFTQRAFLNGKMDLSQAEAVADLIASQNSTQHRIAMQQMRGGISRKLRELRDKLLHLTSLLELELDFSDHEELEFADRSELKRLTQQISLEISRLSGSFMQGNAIKNGTLVAIIGAPNVGKSTLLNALLHDDRAIVSDIQGTTRDVIEDTITIDGHLFRFIDTAGIRKTEDTIEKMGIERSLKASEKAQIIILMTEPGVPFADICPSDGQYIIRVVNKTAEFSALNGVGVDKLERRLVDTVKSSVHDAADSLMITNQRHKVALDVAGEDIRRAIVSLEAGISGDLISEDLRQCISHISEIVGGEITPDEVLGNIFSHFCIGK
ncbi:MAG: tRNA uridine-5-carboxymethylaminomethyl(34) synthesis GTPase MnmE [Bacteroidales bacterium]|nr:tRNA uridine-5-carboxymethylaminomethyl(34) synthesis GTPase MnmE [Bacteroidales bacterium]MCM1148000.1 tRNA uridine-5-carboxymethylaminomethyl(34) synthesis GTPase MnmE [Bacteroidales bacterium]MCM1206924.1 tRNA uridine-5-carboxymethylaminomethyl(34) synthesis GTPase MnmE [Bacillota bacterium]MCM1509558.1 tRNA uridine-5-carboxymethylaminomethyl(34) synthesis GTPase MnmE [Clostridium sp.]